MKDFNLTKDFKLSEFTKSETATRLGISNIPNEMHISNLCKLCKEILQPLRDFYQCPIRINSGYRSLQLNKAVNGAHRSYHLRGRAADITSADFHSLKASVDFLVSIGDITPKELIYYPTFIHIAI